MFDTLKKNVIIATGMYEHFQYGDARGWRPTCQSAFDSIPIEVRYFDTSVRASKRLIRYPTLILKVCMQHATAALETDQDRDGGGASNDGHGWIFS